MIGEIEWLVKNFCKTSLITYGDLSEIITG